MPIAEIFLGVVSHSRSRFTANTSAGGFLHELAEDWRTRGCLAEFVVERRNLFSENPVPLSKSDVQASLSAQLRIDREWARYLAEDPGGQPRGFPRNALLSAGRLWRRVKAPPVTSLERLLNIERSHISLLEQGIHSGAPWIVIVEDDGVADNLEDCATGIPHLVSGAPSEVAYINLSESFGVKELNVGYLLNNSNAVWEGSVTRRVLSAERPVTNTVCAIAYRRDFVQTLLAEFEAQDSFPVLPIDWKLNLTLMSLHERGLLGAGNCWWVTPGPIRQMSMHAVASDRPAT